MDDGRVGLTRRCLARLRLWLVRLRLRLADERDLRPLSALGRRSLALDSCRRLLWDLTDGFEQLRGPNPALRLCWGWRWLFLHRDDGLSVVGIHW